MHETKVGIAIVLYQLPILIQLLTDIMIYCTYLGAVIRVTTVMQDHLMRKRKGRQAFGKDSSCVLVDTVLMEI